MRKIVLAAFVFVLSAGIVISLFPSRYLPPALKPFISMDGDFRGEPIQMTIPASRKPSVPVFLSVKLGQGVCKVSHINPGGEVLTSFTMRVGTYRDNLPPQNVLVLDAGENAGSYYVSAGPQWHLFAPKGRLIILFTCVCGLSGAGVVRNRRVAHLLRRVGRRRLYFISVIIVISSLFLYSIVHEFGHLIVGVLLGARVENVVWTILSGDEPHVSFSYLPEAAGPWMSAGGILLPTLLSLVLIGTWIIFSKRMSWYIAVSLVVPGLIFLFCNIGLLFEVFMSRQGQYSHMEGLALHLGLTNIWGLIFELLPLFLTLIAYALFGCWLKRIVKDKAYQ